MKRSYGLNAIGQTANLDTDQKALKSYSLDLGACK